MSNKKKLKRDLELFRETQRIEDYKYLDVSVILVRPEHAANIGAIARVMANFDFEKLVIFHPIENTKNIFTHRTHGFAMHGKDIIMNAETIELKENENHIDVFKDYLQNFDLVLATTSKGKNASNIQRLAIFPEDLKFPSSVKPLKIAILFGRESRGLDNEEIGLVDIILRIPTSSSYPTLNISHACGIILYEIFKKLNTINIGRGRNPVMVAQRENRQSLLKIIENLIEKLKIRTHKKEKVYFAFRNVFERAFMSKKELSLITGVFSKVENILEDLMLYKD
ncbi:MAG: RNA methyltransferase [Candidatus Thorarchaeota archaeon]